MQIGKLIEMGQIVTIDQDGTKTNYKMALVIEFETADKIKRAIADGGCKFEFNGDA